MLEDCFGATRIDEFKDLMEVSGYTCLDLSKLSDRKKKSLIRCLRQGVMPSKSGVVSMLFRTLCVDFKLGHIYMSTSGKFRLVTWNVPKGVNEDIKAMVALRTDVKDKKRGYVSRPQGITQLRFSPYQSGVTSEGVPIPLGFVRNVMKKYDNRDKAQVEKVIELVSTGSKFGIVFKPSGEMDASKIFTIDTHGKKEWVR